LPRIGTPWAALVVCLGLAPGCHDATDPEIQRVIGRIDRSSTTVPVVIVPNEVHARVPFTVIVHTTGTSDCTKPDGETLVVQDGVARIVPYDVVPIPGHSDVCRNDHAFHQHRTSVTIPTSGASRVRVVGFSASRRDNVLDSVEAAITVRP
jgi:hypothetical protein